MTGAAEVSRHGISRNPDRVRDANVFDRLFSTEPVHGSRTNPQQGSNFSNREQSVSLDQGWTKRSPKGCGSLRLVVTYGTA